MFVISQFKYPNLQRQFCICKSPSYSFITKKIVPWQQPNYFYHHHIPKEVRIILGITTIVSQLRNFNHRNQNLFVISQLTLSPPMMILSSKEKKCKKTLMIGTLAHRYSFKGFAELIQLNINVTGFK